jgi:PelA/Pel-15E family pectate lyase
MKPNSPFGRVLTLIFPLLLLTTSFARGAMIGTNIPARPVTAELIATLPTAEKPVWMDYLARSEKQMQADKNFLRAEMKAVGVITSAVPPVAHSEKGLNLKATASWYGEAEARRLADIVVSFQTPAGGWGKNLNFTKHPRAPGEHFVADNGSLFLKPGDNDQPLDANWSYVGTFDNDATITQLRFLAKTLTAAGTNATTAWRQSFGRGLDYIFAAQYPNGGWPQVWPLAGGYHDNVTYNDDAMLNILKLLDEVAAGKNEFAFVPAAARTQAAASLQRGMDCLFATQVITDGRRTAWCQQYDALSLRPASARNYEMPSLASSESGTIVLFLMSLPKPETNAINAVRAAVAWFDKTKLNGVAFKSTGSAGRKLISAPGTGPIWARYYQIGTDHPIFGDRDKSIHDTVDDISYERRKGYGWFKDTPKRVLEHYPRWLKNHALKD